VNQFASLWGPHFIAVTHKSHVSGNFNQHLFGKRFVFIDEGMFGGDKERAGLIKTRLTESHFLLEAKGVDAVRVPNRMIFMVASNHESVVAADAGDRRWMMIDVGDDHKEDHPYFEAIDRQMRSGGREAMLHDLLMRDIAVGPNPRRILATDALFSQVLRNMEPELRYMHWVLDEGRLPQSGQNDPRTTTIKAMWTDLQETQPDGKWVTPAALGRSITKTFKDIVQKKPNGVYFRRFTSRGSETERSTEYRFADLKACRTRFERAIGQRVEWSNDLEDWVAMPDLC
jgi:hypothetical protein